MFFDTKTLVVVYKDELLLNQFKKLVETNGSPENKESLSDTRDFSINIISWNEKTWLEQKKAGNFSNKILFLGNIKGTDKLIPVIDEKFNEYGVHYGWAGNQAVIYADLKALSKMEDYQNFLAKLADLSIPDNIKQANRINQLIKKNVESESLVPGRQRKKNLIGVVKDIGDGIGNAFAKAGNDVSIFTQDLFKNVQMMEKQMLFYGVINMCDKSLKTFMQN